MICTDCKKQIEEEKKSLIKRLFELETWECEVGPEGCEYQITQKILGGR